MLYIPTLANQQEYIFISHFAKKSADIVIFIP